MKTRTTASVLTYAGALPFVAAALILIFKPPAIQADVELVLRVYSALIVSFVSGIHWQIGISKQAAPGYLLWMSNAVVLASWGFVFAQPGAVAWLLFVMVFAGLLVLDRILFRLELVSSWFYQLRVRISIIVLVSLLVAAFAVVNR